MAFWYQEFDVASKRTNFFSCQASLNSIQQLQRSRKYLHQLETRAAILVFPSARKTRTRQRTLSSCFLSSFIKFRLAVQERSKMPQPIRGKGGHLDSTSYLRWDLASCQVSLKFIQRSQRRGRKCLSQSEAGAAILVFLSLRLRCTKNHAVPQRLKKPHYLSLKLNWTNKYIRFSSLNRV